MGASAAAGTLSPPPTPTPTTPAPPAARRDEAPLPPLRPDAAGRAAAVAAAGSTRFLDGLRGLAAFYVLMRHVTWVPNSDDCTPTWRVIHHALAHFFHYGHMAVIFFFVLSGFVIHLRYARRLHDDPTAARFGWLDFVYRRARRLYPPLIAAILLTWLVDAAGTRMGTPWFYEQAREEFKWIPEAIRDNHHWRTLVGNLLFVMQMHSPVWGSDNPLWSLAYEWWFYMFYPVLWWLGRRSAWRATAAVVALFLLTRIPWNGPAIAEALRNWSHLRFTAIPGDWPQIQDRPYALDGWDLLTLPRRVLGALPTWWCGVLLADVYARRIRIRFKHCAWLIVALVFTFIPRAPEVVKSLAAGLGFSGVIALGFYLQERGVRLWPLNALKCLGDFSYTLYVTHWPLIIFLTPFWAWHMVGRVPLWLSAPLEFFSLAALPLAVAYVLHLFVERPFTRTHRAKVNVPAPVA
jgi:peptidoglycan/LPS O-acetylase OafA/YrhL